MKLSKNWGRLVMKSEWKKYCLGDIIKFKNGKKRPSTNGKIPVYGGNGVLGYTDTFNNGNCIIIGRVGAYCGSVFIEKNNCWISDNAICGIATTKSDINFDYYLLKSLNLNKRHIGTSQPLLTQEILNKIEIKLPSLEEQKKIVSILSALDDKIEVNQKINENLEQQAQAIFKNMFGDDIDNLDNTSTTLSDFIENVDNRGKTPPLSKTKTEYPIIDVKALSGNSRIIDYNNCTKYVDENTYKTWFRSGHPKNYDILISTVGSLAEIKLFLGNKGCIAQNVVGFRCKNISSLYLYQYLKYIKNDLVTYNIGSVQPSIKVTHIIKHKIFVPKMEKLQLFDEIARKFTKQIYNNHNEIENLKNIRDALLPKLMNGEIDIGGVEL